MSKRLNIIQVLFGLSGIGFANPMLAAADPWQMNMYKGVTPISQDIYFLHMIAIYVCAVIGAAVFGVMFYALYHHRKSKGHVPSQFHDNVHVEIFWTLIPFIILIALAVPATKTLIRMDNTDDAEVTIKVVGHQWKWQYEYLNEGINYYSSLSTPYNQIEGKEPKGEWYLLEVDNPVVVPVNKKIRFIVTSNDVIHSWWVPELGVKRDAIPGFAHEAWAKIEKPGTYRGQCAELCGINHAYMPIVVHAVSDDEYAAWVAGQPKTVNQTAEKESAREQPTLSTEALLALGKEKYNMVCSACHGADGMGLPPLYPALKASSIAIGHPISRHISLVLNGVSGTAMQAYKHQLSDQEIAAIVTYERNTWGNNTGDVVQASDVAAVRQHENQPAKIVKKAQAGGLQ